MLKSSSRRNSKSRAPTRRRSRGKHRGLPLLLERLEERRLLTTGYDLQWLGTVSPSDNFSSAQGISDAGQVVGDSYQSNSNGIPTQEKAYSWTAAGGMTDLGALNGNAAYAWGVNNNGEIAGWYHYPVSGSGTTAGGGYYEWAYTAQNNIPSPIPGISQIGGHSSAYGVNDNHIVVGHADAPNGSGHSEAFTYDGTTLRFLGTLGGQWSYGMDINSSNVVAGFADTGANPSTQPGVYQSLYHAAIWTNGVIRDLGTLGTDSYAYKINDLGQVVGSSLGTDGLSHAIYWDGTQLTALPGIAGNSEALSINNQGQIVGASGDYLNGAAFVYQNGAAYDLNMLVNGGVGADKLTRANDINNLGQIVGFGSHNGRVEAFLLTPAGAAAGAVTGGVGTAAQTNAALETPELLVTGGTFVYDGAAHASTANAYRSDGVTPIGGSIVLTYNGSANLPTAAGVYTVLAKFTSTDSLYSDATATATLVIDKATPAFSNLSSPTITAGAAQTVVSGHLAALGTAPSGDDVTVTLNGVVQTAAVDTAGDFSATLDTSSLPAGSYTIAYAYAGNSNFNAALPGAGTLTVNAPVVNPVATSLSIASSLAVSVTGQAVTFTVHVTADGTAPAAAPSGLVTFAEGNVTLGTANVGDGVATFTAPFAAVGKHAITVSYAGDANYASWSATIVQAVQFVALEPTSTAGQFVLAVGGTVYKDKIQLETWNRGAVDAYQVELEAKSGGKTMYAYETSGKAPGKIVEIVVYGTDAQDRLSLDTNGSHIPGRFASGAAIATHSERGGASAAANAAHALHSLPAKAKALDAIMADWGSKAASVAKKSLHADEHDRHDAADLLDGATDAHHELTDAVHAAHGKHDRLLNADRHAAKKRK